MAEHMPDSVINAEGLTSQILSNPHISLEEIRGMVQSVATVMEKNAHFQMLARLPMDVRKRLRGLRKLQMQTSAVEMEFHEKEFELEKQFEAKHKEIFKKRFEIITGLYEPNDEDCDVSDPDILKQVDENFEIFEKLKRQNEDNVCDNVDETENAAVESIPSATKGVPNFWLHILYTNPTFDFLIHKDDEPILKHLIDIRTTFQTEPTFSFTLEFEFEPNPFFENKVLTKEYFMKMKCDDLISYEGPIIYKTTGCDIIWKIQKESRASIFDFFNPPVLPIDVLDPLYEEIKNVLENDFEIGDYIKDNIVPKAILYFTGERDDIDLDSTDSKSDGDESESENSGVDDQFEGENLTK